MRINTPLLLCVLLAAVGVYALYDRIEFYKKSEQGPWSEAALNNPFLAAQRYLEEQHVVVRSDAELSPREDLATRGTLVLMSSTAVKNEFLAEKILDWVEHGGHLIVEASDDADNELLLTKLHITKNWGSEDEDEGDNSSANDEPKPVAEAEQPPTPAAKSEETAEDDDDALTEKKLSQRLREYNEKIKQNKSVQDSNDSKDRQCPTPDPTRLTNIQLPGNSHIIQAQFSNYSRLEQPYFRNGDNKPAADVHKPTFFIRNQSGVHLTQFTLGAGKLTVLSDISIWTRKEIADYDHALLLDALIDPSHPVHFLYGVNMPSLTTLLWRNAYEALCAGVLLLLAWLVYRGRRFGSTLDATSDQRRASSEHWLAAARYQWQNDQAAALIDAVRATIIKQAALRFPGFEQWSEHEQITVLSAESHLSKDILRTALHMSTTDDSDQFCECITTLQQLRRHL
ncbi:MAG: DUF4350 domain-containing protein [Spongiibacteraceae bacterium]